MCTLQVTTVLIARYVELAGRVKHDTEMRKYRKHHCERHAQPKFR